MAAAEAEDSVEPVSAVSLVPVDVDEVVDELDEVLDEFVTLWVARWRWWRFAAAAGLAPASDIATMAAELARDLPSVIFM